MMTKEEDGKGGEDYLVAGKKDKYKNQHYIETTKAPYR
jgi:hypothetical protein